MKRREILRPFGMRSLLYVSQLADHRGVSPQTPRVIILLVKNAFSSFRPLRYDD